MICPSSARPLQWTINRKRAVTIFFRDHVERDGGGRHCNDRVVLGCSPSLQVCMYVGLCVGGFCTPIWMLLCLSCVWGCVPAFGCCVLFTPGVVVVHVVTLLDSTDWVDLYRLVRDRRGGRCVGIRAVLLLCYTQVGLCKKLRDRCTRQTAECMAAHGGHRPKRSQHVYLEHYLCSDHVLWCVGNLGDGPRRDTLKSLLTSFAYNVHSCAVLPVFFFLLLLSSSFLSSGHRYVHDRQQPIHGFGGRVCGHDR
jgi:hypothetical protein